MSAKIKPWTKLFRAMSTVSPPGDHDMKKLHALLEKALKEMRVTGSNWVEK